MDAKPKVAVIIPAYNEARNIASLLGVLREVCAIGEIIVVDDGSLDETAERVREAAGLDSRIRLVQHPRNRGKGQAVLTGREATRASILLLLDADLKGLKPQQVVTLMNPVLEGHVDMTLGLFTGGHILTDLAHWGAPWLTGQRALVSRLLDEIDVEAASGYGFETALTLVASHKHARKKVVWLRGVWHPPSEFHRGFFHGVSTRARMYYQIVRAWHKAGGWSSLWRRAKKWVLPLLVAALLFLVYRTATGYYAAGSPSEFGALPMVDVDGFNRILVVAPHPDDETLGAGGLIQLALAKGSQVKVIVVTNGDGQKFAPAVLSKKLRPGPRDYVAMGERRQTESEAALQKLGLPPQDMIFLGYPDRGIGPMWLADWRSECPYLSSYTKTAVNPYPDTYSKGERYCGKDLLDNLYTLMDSYRPDLIIVPHPSDQHPDHGAVSDFARMAAAMIAVREEGYMPEMWGYIVHYGMFPEPRGKHFDKFLVPPRTLFRNENHWERMVLDPAVVSAKFAAINDYSSQMLLLGQFLPSFARRNELYESLPLDILSPLDFDTFTADTHEVMEDIDSGLPYTTNEEFPVRGNMFMGWQTVRLGNTLRVELKLRKDVLPDLKCTLLLKHLDGRTDRIELRSDGSLFASRIFWTQLDLNALGDPSLIAFAAETRQGGLLLSKTGWHILILR